MKTTRKQTLIAGALTSSAGVFISKALGLLYVVPFVAMAAEDYSLYSKAYALYDILLNLSTAGIPFAIASMVAKYHSHQDYKTLLLVKKISTSLLMGLGLFMAVMLIIFATPYATAVSAVGTTLETIEKFSNVLVILSISLFLVPMLSAYRGFYQGLKDLKKYSISQVLEQFARVALLLLLGAFFVYVLSMDSIWAVYMAILSTGVSALIAILYFRHHQKDSLKELRILAKKQESKAKSNKYIIRELITFGIPFLLVALLGNSMNIVNSTFFERTLTGVSPELAANLNGIIHLKVHKLIAIPQVLAIGFSAGIVPYVTSAFEKRDYAELRKNINDVLNIVTYIALPLCFCLLVLARPIYFIMYGDVDLDYGTEALAYSSMLAFTGTLAPICSNLLLTLRLRKQVIFFLMLSFIVKLVTFFPLMQYTGYTGAITSSVINGVFMIVISLYYIAKVYKVHYRELFRNSIFMLISLVSMYGSFVILGWFNLSLSCESTLITFIELAIYGLVGMSVYFLTSAFFRVPQRLFKMGLSMMFKKVLGRFS